MPKGATGGNPRICSPRSTGRNGRLTRARLLGRGILSKFKVAPGFKVELVASEPMVKDPVFVDWDDQGRMWVGELRTYMIDLDGSNENERKSRVMVLEDTDGDGKMDKSTAFVDDMINALHRLRRRRRSGRGVGSPLVLSGQGW